MIPPFWQFLLVALAGWIHGMGPWEYWTPHGLEKQQKLPQWQPLFYHCKSERLEQAVPLELQPE